MMLYNNGGRRDEGTTFTTMTNKTINDHSSLSSSMYGEGAREGGQNGNGAMMVATTNGWY
jgi:hypothetical protein